jgi:hypothetical protein
MGYYKKLAQQKSDKKRLSRKKGIHVSVPSRIRQNHHKRALKVRYSDKVLWADLNAEAMAYEVDNWLTRVEGQLMESVLELESKGKRIRRKKEDFLANSIRGNMYIQFGDLTRVGFSFARHGVYWYRRVSNRHRVGNERDIQNYNWFNPIIEQNIGELEQIVKRYYADAVVNVFNVYIKNDKV